MCEFYPYLDGGNDRVRREVLTASFAAVGIAPRSLMAAALGPFYVRRF